MHYLSAIPHQPNATIQPERHKNKDKKRSPIQQPGLIYACSKSAFEYLLFLPPGPEPDSVVVAGDGHSTYGGRIIVVGIDT